MKKTKYSQSQLNTDTSKGSSLPTYGGVGKGGQLSRAKKPADRKGRTDKPIPGSK